MHLQLLLIVIFRCLLIFAGSFNDTLIGTALCLLSFNQQETPGSCLQAGDGNCSANFETPNFKLMKGVLKPPEPICKTLDRIVLTWNATSSSSFLELYPYVTDAEKHIYTEPTTCNKWVLRNLEYNSFYEIRLWMASFRNETYFLESSDPYYVHPIVPPHGLRPIPNFKVYNLSRSEKGYDAFITWTSASDIPCCYRLDAYGVDTSKQVSTAECEMDYPPYKGILRGLSFGYTFNISVRSILHYHPSFIEGPASYAIVKVPTCLEAYSNLSICAPPQPENVVALATCDAENKNCYVMISWSTPELIPDNYLINFNAFSADDDIQVMEITAPGTVNSTVLKNVPTGTYDILIRAVSKAGYGRSIKKELVIPPDDLDDDSVTRNVAITIPIFATAIIIVVVFIVFWRQRVRFGTSINSLYSKELFKFELSKKPSNEINRHRDEWEILRENITFEDMLGEGAFGLVKKGILKKTDGQMVEVAIKMLKPHASSEETRQLFQEISIMKSVGTHPNLVSMIGCVTEKLDGPLLLVEYCPHGDLQSFLRKEWERLNNFCRDNKLATTDNKYSVFNKAYAFNNAENFLTSNDLLSFARQITLGMEHLSKLKVLHRDLAARNVLVLDNKLVKVSDFGLSRDVYQNNVYCKKGSGKLPIRWMAPESITHQRYTTHSDVWSFGVLLWEIVTLGEYPYPEVCNADLLEFLKNGHRMQKPRNCEDELYQIMLSCWKDNPKERPTFTALKKQLETLLQDAANYLYVNV